MFQKRLIIIFLSDAQRAADLATYFNPDEYESLVPESTDAFYRILNTQGVDLVIVDNQLPGFLSGIELLERLHNDLLRPTAVLIAVANAALNERIETLRIRSVIRPSATVPQIADLALSAMNAENVAQVPIDHRARRLVQEADSVRPLPQILVKYLSQLDTDTCSTDELAKDISVDPKMTSVLLRLMNSAALSVRTRFTRVVDAVNFLGVRKTVALILSASLAEGHSRSSKSFPGEMRIWYQNRCLLIASVAAAFARQRGESSPDTAYVLGLLQELGIPVLAHAYGEKYLENVGRVRDVGQLRLEISEHQEFGITHADVSAALLQKWGLPQSLIRLVVSHHRPDSSLDLGDTEWKFLRLMRIGEAVANLFDKRTPQRHQLLNQMLTRYEMGTPQEWHSCLADAIVKTRESAQLFSIPVPDEAGLCELASQLAADTGDPETTAANTAAVASDTPDIESVKPAEPTPERLSRHVLVIDDEPRLRQMITQMLQPEGISVRSCEKAEEAVPLSAGACAILCDVHLGTEEGMDVVRELRRSGYAAPIIMMSGDRTRTTVEESIDAGINDYLVKPFDRRLLISKLKRHIGVA